jgi:hypothetical protein
VILFVIPFVSPFVILLAKLASLWGMECSAMDVKGMKRNQVQDLLGQNLSEKVAQRRGSGGAAIGLGLSLGWMSMGLMPMGLMSLGLTSMGLAIGLGASGASATVATSQIVGQSGHVSPSLTISGPALQMGGHPVLLAEAGRSGRRLPLSFATPKLPKDRGAPTQRSAGASRDCAATELPTVALVPEYPTTPKANKAPVWGLTSAEKPTLWVSTALGAADIQAMHLVILSPEGMTLREKALPVPLQPSVFAVALDHPLQAGDRYQWSIAIQPKCNPEKLEFISGWVERRALSPLLQDRLGKRPPEDQARFYARRGLWYDALNAIAQARLQQPTDGQLIQDWQQLLGAIALPQYSGQPLQRPLEGPI